ncbi:unnamed protein product, partial [marine sediment metagenome]
MGILSSAEHRMVRGDPLISRNYRRLLSARISKKLLDIIELLTNPNFAPWLDSLENSGKLGELT